MQVVWVPGRRGLGLGEIYGGIGLLALATARFFPFERFPSLWACPLYHYAGVPCLTCGATRAFVRSAHLDLGQAFHVSPLGSLLFLALAAFVILAALRWSLRWPWPSLRLSRREGWIVRILLAMVALGSWSWVLVRHFVVGDWG